MSNFKVEFEYVGCLQKVGITIDEEAINIKYGVNGIGKTTIIKGLKYFDSGLDDKSRHALKEAITSFEYPDKEPKCVKPSQLDHVLVYDRDYFNNLFAPRKDLLTNTYELVIKDQHYRDSVQTIEAYWKDLMDFVKKDEFTKVIDFYTKVIGERKTIDRAKNGKIKVKTSIFPSFGTKGILLEAVKEGTPIAQYAKYMNGPNRSLWLKWIEDYKFEWTADDVCPFCGQHIKKADLEKNIGDVLAHGSSGDIKAHNDDQNKIEAIASNLNESKRQNVLDILKIDALATEENLKPVEEAVSKIYPEVKKLSDIKNLDAVNLLQTVDGSGSMANSLNERLDGLFLDENVLFVADSEDSDINLVSGLNGRLRLVKDKVDDLGKNLIGLRKEIQKKASANRKVINEFLKIAGVPYEVNIEGTGNEAFATLFSYKGRGKNIDNKLQYLSYGEANALALVLFGIEARSSSSLIVLDDPVSSFDSNKRYAIYDYLFNANSNLLYGKTVLLMTHDFQTVVAFAKSSSLKNKNVSFAHLAYGNGILSERPFYRRDLESSVAWYRAYAGNASNNLMARLVAARRCVEIAEGTNLFYSYLSSLIHLRKQPTKDENGSNPLKPNEIAKCDEFLRKMLGEAPVTYNDCLAKCDSYQKLFGMYKSVPPEDPFAKTCLVRPMVQMCQNQFPNIKDPISKDLVMNFLNESFHPETQFIYYLKGVNSIEIPSYIISLCDDAVSNLDKLIANGKIQSSI